MSDLFERRCTVIMGKPPENFVDLLPGAIEVKGLRVQFKVSKSLDKHPNTCEVSITNLSAKTRKDMQAKGARVIVSAGYKDTESQIFAGDARYIEHVRMGPDWVTKVQCGDGERAYQNGRVNGSWGPGTSIVDVLKSAAKSLFVDPGNLNQKVTNLSQQFVNGYAAQGKASVELDKVLAPTGYEWSIQDGRLQLLRPGETTTDSVVELSPTSGLIGSPEHGTPDKKGGPATIKIKSLLQASIKPGGKVVVNSAEYRGAVFRVLKVEHRGDTAGGDWYSEIEAHAL